MFDRPFRELHELYKIVFQRAEAQAAAEKKKAEEEEEQRRKENPNTAKHPHIVRSSSTDVKNTNPKNISSPLEAEALEDALEELVEGGVM